MRKVYEEISDEELRSLTDVIKTKFGIDFSNYEKKSLKRGFARIITKNNLGSILGLWQQIINSNAFLSEYIDELTINLTELFRNAPIWKAIESLIQNNFKEKPVLHIWHAGCSTGEEVYSMAILLKQLGLLSKNKTWATDLSQAALDKAKKGHFSHVLKRKYEKGLKAYLPTAKIESYFEIYPDESFKIKPEFQKHIQFEKHNLVTGPVTKKFDLIFCRNVMIYFDEALKIQVLNKLFDSLNNNGFLIIGFYDSMPASAKENFELIDSKSRIYKKIDKSNTIPEPEPKDAIARLRKLTSR